MNLTVSINGEPAVVAGEGGVTVDRVTKARPILFSAPMVRALLAGTKTQTRRIMNPQPEPIPADVVRMPPFDGSGFWWSSGKAESMVSLHDAPCMSPYGYKGDRLWVRETWRTWKKLDDKSPTRIAEMCLDAGYKKPWSKIQYVADGYVSNDWAFDGGDTMGKTRVSIHLPRWASRITLEVTEVRVQRLQDISPEDAMREGVGDLEFDEPLSSVEAFEALWTSINGAGSWTANPWVWAVSFRRVQP